MTAEDRVKMTLGDLIVAKAVADAKIEELQAKLAEAEKPKEAV